MKSTVHILLVSFLILPFSSADGSWHWSSDFEVCGTDVIKKGEKCDLHTENKNEVLIESSVNSIEKQPHESVKTCKNELVPILKSTSNSLNCVKEPSLEKLIQSFVFPKFSMCLLEKNFA